MGHIDVNHSHGDTAEKGRDIKQGTYAAEEKEHTDDNYAKTSIQYSDFKNKMLEKSYSVAHGME